MSNTNIKSTDGDIYFIGAYVEGQFAGYVKCVSRTYNDFALTKYPYGYNNRRVAKCYRSFKQMDSDIEYLIKLSGGNFTFRKINSANVK